MKVLFISKNLIGDALNIAPALRQWVKELLSPVDMWMQTLPDHVAPLYEGMVRDLWNPGTLIHTFGTVFERPNIDFDFEFNFDVSTAFQLCDKNKYHIAEGYAEMLGVKLSGGNEKLKPIFIPEPEEISVVENAILVSMFSASCESRDANVKGLKPNKMLLARNKSTQEWTSYEKWIPMLKLIKEEYPDNPVRFLGAPNDVVPDELKKYGQAMFGIKLNRLAVIMQKATLLVTIDNGMAHLGASQEMPTFEMYPRVLGPHYILPVGNPNLVWVQMDPAWINPAQLVHGLKYAIQKFKAKGE